MSLRLIVLSCALAFLSACSSTSTRSNFSNAYVAGHSISKPISCVPYARDVSGVPIRGDAHTWWYQAEGQYGRGHVPRVGAIYVLSKSSRLRYGHLSVVTRVLNPRTIEVTHSNWGSNRATRSVVYKRMRVEDVSATNDWSRARFWNKDINAYGLPYEASGFIYPGS